MLGRAKAEPHVEEPEEVDRQASEVAERLAEDRKRLVAIDAQVGDELDLDRREDLREERRRTEERIADARGLHSKLVDRRDRLARERGLRELDPLREKIASGKAQAQELRALLATIDSAVAAAEETLADGEDRILRPQLSEGEEQEARWLVGQWKTGGAVEVHLARMPRRLRKAVLARMQAIADAVPADVAAYRERARASFEQAGTPLWDPQQPVAIPPVELPDPDKPQEPPYARLS